jgi:outer membrane receptor protein involved in Fe transport
MTFRSKYQRRATRAFAIAATSLLTIGASKAYAQSQTASSSKGEDAGALEEVVVTAQKREERLQDVPVPVTAINADRLIDRNQVRLQDYFAEVPSFNLNSTGNGQSTIVLRGINTGGSANPAFGVTVDDIPFGSSSAYGYGDRLVPDLDPTDLQRIEVLRGPQGTLYGASNIGGLLKFVTKDPSLTQLNGRVQLDVTSIAHGDSGYGARAGVSIPLISDKLAFSVSAFKRKDAGFIDDSAIGAKDVNDVEFKGGRAALLWQLSDAFSIKLAALAQDTNGQGTNSVDANSDLEATGGLAHAGAAGVGGYDLKVRLYTATVNVGLGDYQLTSLSGWGTNDYLSPLEFNSAFWGSLSQAFFGVSGNTLVNSFRTEKFTQELRLSSPTGGRLEWMVGAFYTHEKTPVSQTLTAAEPTTGQVAGDLISFFFPTKYQEHAVFGDLTVKLTDTFDTQFGARYSENKQTYDETDFGAAAELLFGAPEFTFPTQRAKDHATTFLVTPRWRISPDAMIYVRLASGYRPGGNNGEATAFNLPLTFKPDKTVNYELGAKGALLDRALTYDASVYYIDWKDVQIAQTDQLTGLSFFTNGGKAKSRGAELALTASPRRGLTLTASGSVGKATLKGDLPLTAGVGFKGDRLPLSPRFAASLSAEQEFPITDKASVYAGGTFSHIGNRLDRFVNPISTNPLVPGVRSKLPAYDTLNLRAGLRYDTWTFGAFVDNVGDKRGMLSGGSAAAGSALPTDPYTFSIIRPRTYGMSVAKTF